MKSGKTSKILVAVFLILAVPLAAAQSCSYAEYDKSDYTEWYYDGEESYDPNPGDTWADIKSSNSYGKSCTRQDSYDVGQFRVRCEGNGGTRLYAQFFPPGSTSGWNDPAVDMDDSCAWGGCPEHDKSWGAGGDGVVGPMNVVGRSFDGQVNDTYFVCYSQINNRGAAWSKVKFRDINDHVNDPPKINLVSPNDGATGVVRPPDLRVEVENSRGGDVEIQYKDGSGNGLATYNNVNPGTETSFEWNGLSQGTIYEWQVTAIEENFRTATSTSNIWDFKTYSPTSKTYKDSQKYTWTVPENAYMVTVELWGAEGGKGKNNPSNRRKGGYIKANYSVNGGETLNIRPGGVGGDAYTGSSPNVVFGGPGGFNGGGDGGNADKEDSTTHYGGGGGGGRTDIRINGDTLSDQIFVAGGGGGNPGGSGIGGAGGANTGQDGEDNLGATGGGGGTQNNGGGPGLPDSGDDSNQGFSGSRGSGGGGGYGENNEPAIGGGGGGAGYYGGGGGAGQAGGGESAGGGGGGSNYIVPSATTLSNQRGVDADNGGDGKVALKWYLNTEPDMPQNPSPKDRKIVQSDSVTLSALYSDPDGDPGNLYFFDEDSNMIGSCAVDDGESCGVSWSSYSHGENDWYAVAGDGYTNTTSPKWALIKNRPPNVVVSPVSPENDTKTTTNDVWFNVSVSDPDGDSLNVDYFTNQTGPSSIGSDTTPSGSTASHYETGLQRQKVYGWNAEVSDGWNTTSSNEWVFTVNRLPSISDPEPEDKGAASGEPVNLSVQVVEPDVDDPNIYVDFYRQDGTNIGGMTVDEEGRAWTEVSGIQIGEKFKWYVEASDGDESISSPIYEFTKTTGESYRTFTRIEYDYSAVNMAPGETRTLFFEIHNNVDYDKSLKLYLEGINAEFADGSPTKEFDLESEEEERFRVDLKPNSDGDKHLRVVTENKEIIINSTNSIPVKVSKFEAQGTAKEVPGLTTLNVLFMLVAGLLLYYRQL